MSTLELRKRIVNDEFAEAVAAAAAAAAAATAAAAAAAAFSQVSIYSIRHTCRLMDTA
jgi:hypothetical protein